MSKYAWKLENVMPIDAEVAGNELERIAMKYGGILLPKAVVDESRSPDAPLHPAFEWDDTVAAEKYREEQARYIIRSIVIQKPAEENEVKVIRAYVNIVENDERVYIPIQRAMEVDQLRRQVIERAKNDMQVFIRRYETYEELSDLVSYMRDYLVKL